MRSIKFGMTLLLLACSMAGLGCHSKPKYSQTSLPLPPGADSGLYDGQFIQTDYGFALPLPSKWLWLRLSAEQEVDEVARFQDAQRDILVRFTVQLRGEDQSLSAKSWAETSEADLKNHLFKVVKKGSNDDLKTGGTERWYGTPFQITDGHGNPWMAWEYALSRGDLLIGAHAMLPLDEAGTEKGKKLLKALQGSLSEIHWYMPIGPRGISIERFELQRFTEGFRQALESRSLTKVNSYLDEMFPERSKWNAWYQQKITGDPKSFELHAELAGLVINGDYASAAFTLSRKDAKDQAPQSETKSFKLSKKEGSWKITASLDKK